MCCRNHSVLGRNRKIIWLVKSVEKFTFGALRLIWSKSGKISELNNKSKNRVRTILALGYWVLPNIVQYWVLGNTFIGCQTQYQYYLDTLIPVARR